MKDGHFAGQAQAGPPRKKGGFASLRERYYKLSGKSSPKGKDFKDL